MSDCDLCKQIDIIPHVSMQLRDAIVVGAAGLTTLHYSREEGVEDTELDTRACLLLGKYDRLCEFVIYV